MTQVTKYPLALQLFLLLSMDLRPGHTTGLDCKQNYAKTCQNARHNKYTVLDLSDEELFKSGHLKPFGSHRPPDEIVEELPFMISPEDFYMNYVVKHKPVVLKGAVKRWPAYTLWTDDYLNKTYGDKMFNMETKDDDKWNIPNSMKLKDFLEIYKHADRYLVDEVPPEMREEIVLPLCLRCEEMDKYFFVSYFWFSQGNTSSQIHIDTDENVLCVIKGHKEVIMVSPVYSHDLHSDSSRVLGVSDIDVSAVDLEKYPRVKNVRYFKAIVEEGDMVYIPQMWWHHVYSPPGRQQAVALWWKSKPWSTKDGRKSFPAADNLKEGHLEKKYSYANVLAEYEKWVQNISDKQPAITCNEQKALMSEYVFETDKDPDSEQTLGDGGDMEEDDPAAYKESYTKAKLSGKGIRDTLSVCDFDRDNLKCPCYYKPCRKDDNDLKCIRYTLDYCADFQDRGCVIQLPHLLNKVGEENYAIIKNMTSEYN